MGNKTDKIAKPFLKWAGGKTQFITEIEKSLPYEITNKKRRSINANADICYLAVPLSGRPFRSNLLFAPHKRIFTSIPNAKTTLQ